MANRPIVRGFPQEDLVENADDVTSIDHYRISILSEFRSPGVVTPIQNRWVTVSEIDPDCEAVIDDNIVKFETPEDAEEARDMFAQTNSLIGLQLDAAVVGVNAAGVILAIDGENVLLPDGSDM